MNQFLRFTVIGGMGTAAHYAVLILLVSSFAANPVVGSTAGFLVGMVINYLLNRRFTFTSQRSIFGAFWRFGTVALTGMVINAAIMAVLIESMGVYYLLAQLVATAMTLLWNFFGSRYWAFRET